MNMKLQEMLLLSLSFSLSSLLVDGLISPMRRISTHHNHQQPHQTIPTLLKSNSIQNANDPHTVNDESSRRKFLTGTIGLVSTVTLLLDPYNTANVANAIPMISTNEFNTIIRDSARSIEVVEFSGPKSETVKIILVDGTTIGINDVIESSTDPRSPLKVAAMCKANQIPYKFTNIEAVLNAAPRKKKVYTNERVLQAAEKEKEKAIRMEQDEELRQQQLREMQ